MALIDLIAKPLELPIIIRLSWRANNYINPFPPRGSPFDG